MIVFQLLGFIWRNALPALRWPTLLMAVLSGLSRDAVMVVVNGAATNIGSPEIWTVWLPAFLATVSAYVILHFYYPILSQRLITDMVARLRLRMTRNLLNAPTLYVHTFDHGALYHIMTQDVQTVARFSRTICDLLPSAVFLLIAAPYLISISPVAGLFALLIMVGGTYGYYRQQRAISRVAVDIRQLDIDYFDRVADTLSGFRELKIHERRTSDLVSEVDDRLQKSSALQVLMTRLYSTSEVLVQGLKFTLLGGVAFVLAVTGETNPTTVFKLITVVLFCLTPFESLISTYPQFLISIVSFKRVDETDRQFASYTRPDETIGQAVEPFESLEMKGLEADYSSTTGDTGFRLGPVDFTLRAGEVVFIVGDNGSGKSTFLQVLAGLFDASAGTLLLNGERVTRHTIGAYRSHFSIVFTHFHLFYRLFGQMAAQPEAVRALLRMLDLDSVTDIADGRFTRTNLSSGQRRRLALATALLEDRDIIILDEFVADQDPKKRAYFFQELIPELRKAGKTVIVTTHDLAWAHHCDRLVRFAEGRIESERWFRSGVEIAAPPSGDPRNLVRHAAGL
jgi:putative ATP-binding cassette transporter